MTTEKTELHKLFKALGHPLRAKVLRTLIETDHRSPSDISVFLGDKIGNVSYHTRMLLEYGLIFETGTQMRRGAVEHFYEAKPEAVALMSAVQKLEEQLNPLVSA